MENIIVRKAEKTDLTDILGLYRILETGEEESLTLDEAEQIFESMRQYPDYALYVAECSGRVIGAFALLVMDNLAHHGAPSGVVEDVAVHPDWQGKGIGRQMMEFAMQHCRQRRCYKLALSSNLRREAAHRFYEGLGFKQHGVSFLVEL